MTKNKLASGCPVPMFKILVLKMIMVISATGLQATIPRINPIIVIVCAWLIIFYMVEAVRVA